jgi:hypothetical protein
MHPNVVYPWYPLQRGGHIHETQLVDNRALAFTFADADGTLVAIPEEVVRVLETLPDSGSCTNASTRPQESLQTSADPRRARPAPRDLEVERRQRVVAMCRALLTGRYQDTRPGN